MAGGLWGADIEALRRLADTIADGGTSLDGVITTIEASMPEPATWGGPDSEQFRHEWSGTHLVRLRETATLLSDVAARVRENADDQERTSTSDGSGGAGGGVGAGGGAGAGGGGGAGAGGGGGGSNSSGGGNPLAPAGSEPSKKPTGPGEEGHSWLDDGWSTHDGSRAEYSWSNADDVTSSEKGNINHTFAEWETGGFAGWQEGAGGMIGSEDGAFASGDVGVAVGAGYDASAEFSLSENGLVAEGSVGGQVGASANASGQVGYGEHLGAEVNANAFVGGRAEADAGLSIGPHGLGASVGGEAFVGAEAGIDGSVNVAGVTAGGGANVYAGAGIHAGADVNLGWDSVGVDLNFGAALGIGAGFDVSLEWSPADTVSAITDLGGDLVDGAGSLLSSAGSGLKSGFGLWG